MISEIYASWFEGRGNECTLVIFVDDTTSRITLSWIARKSRKTFLEFDEKGTTCNHCHHVEPDGIPLLVEERLAWCVLPSGVFITPRGQNSEIFATLGN